MRLPIITPKRANKNLNNYLVKHKNYILQQTFVFGAILFRDWSPTSLEDVTNSLSLVSYDMSGSAAPRTKISNGIYTSNDAPPDATIPFHHELGQRKDPPSYILFQCRIPASCDGYTPIVDSRKIVKWFMTKYPEESKLIEKGVRYKRVMPTNSDKSSPIGRSWKDTFGVTSDIDMPKMSPDGTTYRWLQNGDLETTSTPISGIRMNERTGVSTFVNSIVAARLGWNDVRNNGENAVTYSDGTTIEKSLALDIENQMQKKSIKFKWQKGDILLIDNSVMMHSRSTFSGERLLYTRISGPPIRMKKTNDAVLLPSWDYMPKLALGCWKLHNTQESVFNAIKSGIRHIDCASDYENEKEVGKSLARAFDEKLVKREDIFITSKLWNTHHNHVEQACIQTMSDLGLDYLDLYMIHFPISLEYTKDKMSGWQSLDEPMSINRIPFYKTWKQMESLVFKGLVKNIGICNLPVAMISDLLSYAKIHPSVLQVEIHPYNTQDKLRKFCKHEGIRIAAFSPLGSTGYMSEKTLLDDPLIINIATKYKCLPASIILEWSKARTDCTVFRTENLFHLQENIKSIPLNDKELKAIDALNLNKRFNDPGVFTETFGGFEPIFD